MSKGLSRRLFLHWIGKLIAGGLAVLGTVGLFGAKVWASAKRKLLPAGTSRAEMAKMAPTLIDAGNIPPTPLADFDVMGTTDHHVDIARWRLHIVGAVSQPTSWTYDQLLAQPVVERKVLMICPLVFANQGVWRGFSIWPLLQASGIDSQATHLVAQGPEGEDRLSRRFSLQDVRAGKVFLSYAVNGQPLPVRHGYPLRIVADDELGDEWIKYVYKLEVYKT